MSMTLPLPPAKLSPRKFGVMFNRLRTNKSGKSPRSTQRSLSVGISNTLKRLETPKRRARTRYAGLSHGDSPSDGELQQDIIWDPTSPTDNQRQGSRDTRAVKISDIADRIAPKDGKPASMESPLMQWIGDSSVLCTPEVRPPRLRRTSTRQSDVDLVKLARQFDINMHNQDKESIELTNTISNLDTSKHKNVPGQESGETVPPSRVGGVTSLASKSQQVEEELQALFDGPTQRISGRLSQSSSASTCSQPGVSHPRTQGPEVKSSRSGHVSGPGKQDDMSKGTAVNVDFDDDWDDLFDDSLLEMNSEVQPEVASKPNSRISSRLSTSKSEPAMKSLPPFSASKPTSVLSPGQATSVPTPVSRSSLIELCPKPKTTNRSTFKLDSNPSFQGKTAVTKDVPKPSLTKVKPHPDQTRPDQGCSTSRSDQGCSTSRSDQGGSTSRSDQGGSTSRSDQGCSTSRSDQGCSMSRPNQGCSTSRPNQGGSTSKPDQGGSTSKPDQGCSTSRPNQGGSTSKPDQGCSTSRPNQGGSTSKPDQGCSSSRPVSSLPATSDLETGDSGKVFSDEDLQSVFDSESQWDDGDDDELLCRVCDTVERTSNSQPEPEGSSGRQDNQQTAPLPVRRDRTVNRGLPCGYVRSNSSPGTSSVAVNFQGWNIKSKADNNQSRMSLSYSGSGPGKFTQIRSAPGWGAVGSSSATFQPVDAKSTVQQHTVTARNAKNSNSHHAPSKRPLADSVVMTNKVLITSRMERCSQAEIERKKQEALARRRARILASQNSGGGQSQKGDSAM